jgi:hypothetical protein
MWPGGFFVIFRWTPRQRGQLTSRFHSSRQLDVNLPDLYSEVSHRTPGIVAAPPVLGCKQAAATNILDINIF